MGHEIQLAHGQLEQGPCRSENQELLSTQRRGLAYEAGLLYLDHLFGTLKMSEVTWKSTPTNERSRRAALGVGFSDRTKQFYDANDFGSELAEKYLALTGNEFPGVWAYEMTRNEWKSGAKSRLEQRISARRAANTGPD